MNADTRQSLSLPALAVAFLGLAAAMWFDVWGHPALPPVIPETPPEFTNTATVRMSAADLFRTEGDTSGFSCYACHDKDKQLTVKLDTNGSVVLSEPHQDIVMRHGRNNRNEHCFICHDPKNLEVLRAHEGQAFKLTESTRLCGSCHGPSLRDWEIGVHGRTVGFWKRELGAISRADCTSCHDPHSPAFPSIKPGPPPHLRHPKPAPVADPRKGH